MFRIVNEINTITATQKTRVRRTGIRKQTVNFHIKNILHCDAIRFTLRFNPTNMGSFIHHIIFVQMNSKVEKTIKEITAMFDKRCLEPPVVAEKQIMLPVYSDIFEMDGMEQKVRVMQNVQSVDVFVLKSI